MAKSKGKSIVTFVIMGLLVLGLAGFGVTNFGGSVRAVASVGDTEVGIDDYARAVQGQMQLFQRQTGQQMTFQQAQAFGIDRMALAQLIGSAALEDEVARVGISVGDENVGQRIQNSPDFRNASGTFDRQVYQLTLQQSGLNVDAYEQRIREADLNRYAQLLVEHGTRLRPGQELFLSGGVIHRELASRIAEAARTAGATHVHMDLEDPLQEAQLIATGNPRLLAWHHQRRRWHHRACWWL